MTSVYLIGSLRNPIIPGISVELREKTGFEVFDDWFAPGPRADDHWKEYEEARGHTYEQALNGWAAQHIFEFDKHHIDRCDIGLLIMPAGKSGHLELGYMIGQGKPGYILMDAPDRWDVMAKFAEVHFNIESLVDALREVGP